MMASNSIKLLDYSRQGGITRGSREAIELPQLAACMLCFVSTGGQATSGGTLQYNTDRPCRDNLVHLLRPRDEGGHLQYASSDRAVCASRLGDMLEYVHCALLPG